jgi:hypothetical protein
MEYTVRWHAMEIDMIGLYRGYNEVYEFDHWCNVTSTPEFNTLWL